MNSKKLNPEKKLLFRSMNGSEIHFHLVGENTSHRPVKCQESLMERAYDTEGRDCAII